MSAEQWAPVVGYEGRYEVSDQGRVRSIDRVTSHGRRRRGQLLKQIPHMRGYLLVNLWRDNSARLWLVHRLVLAAFAGPAPEGAEGRHGVGGPADNRLSNLAWGTHSDNMRDQVAHGTHAHASKTHCSQGHAFDEANTYHYPDRVHRACRKCRARWVRNAAERRSRISEGASA